jgi:transcriptional regulator with XRE-family HTH domain
MLNPAESPPTRLAELVLSRPTLTQIAQEAGCSVGYVSAIAAGRKPASAKVRRAASRILNLPVSEIFPEA